MSLCAIVERSLARGVFGSSPGGTSRCILQHIKHFVKDVQCATLLQLVVDPISHFSKPAIPETNVLESILQDQS